MCSEACERWGRVVLLYRPQNGGSIDGTVGRPTYTRATCTIISCILPMFWGRYCCKLLVRVFLSQFEGGRFNGVLYIAIA